MPPKKQPVSLKSSLPFLPATPYTYTYTSVGRISPRRLSHHESDCRVGATTRAERPLQGKHTSEGKGSVSVLEDRGQESIDSLRSTTAGRGDVGGTTLLWGVCVWSGDQTTKSATAGARRMQRDTRRPEGPLAKKNPVPALPAYVGVGVRPPQPGRSGWVVGPTHRLSSGGVPDPPGGVVPDPSAA